MQPSISIRDLKLSFGSIEVLKDLNLDISDGEFLVLLGSSGSGKSTLLNCIAGLLDITDGQIFMKGRNVTWDEPNERGIGMVFQSYALYPQMSVEGNLAFGLKNARVPKAEIKKRIARTAEVLQIEHLLNRKPAALSGGQRQRVAIGRALVRDVDVFLFDEPLSNLDAKLRADLRVEIKRLHQKLENTMVYVTHDQVEAMTLADRIAIMKGGVIIQLDTPAVIYNRPANKYVADFIGSPAMNFLSGDLSVGDAPHFTTKGMDFSVKGYEFTESAPSANSSIWLGIRPEHIQTAEAAQQCPIQFDAQVDLIEPMGSDTQVWSTASGQQFRFRMDGQAQVSKGDWIRIGFDPVQLSLFDREIELRL